jgi:hypothetical protein
MRNSVVSLRHYPKFLRVLGSIIVPRVTTANTMGFLGHRDKAGLLLAEPSARTVD